MSAKVHLFTAIDAPGTNAWRSSHDSTCGRWIAWRRAYDRDYPPHARARMATADAFRWLPREAQCGHCARVVASVVEQRHICAVSLFCAGLAGWVDAECRDLMSAYLDARAPDTDALIPLLDYAEDIASGQGGAWPEVAVEWPRIEELTVNARRRLDERAVEDHHEQRERETADVYGADIRQRYLDGDPDVHP